MSEYLRDEGKFYKKILDDMKQTNSAYDILIREREELLSNISNCQSCINDLKYIEIIVSKKLREYREGMISKLEEGIQFGINRVSPKKHYKVKLKALKYRAKDILKLYLIDEEGRYLPPKILEGDMLNQVLSFCAITITTLQSGFNTVYYDEAFASANHRSQVLIRELIQDYCKLGVKFIFVSQSPILLAGLDRHVIELVSETNSVESVKEYTLNSIDYDNTNDDYIIQILDELYKKGE